MSNTAGAVRGSLLGGTLLVTGTAVGGGMLALPVLTATCGLIPSLCIYFASWLCMVITGLLFLEIALWMPEGANIVSMAAATLGKRGKIGVWVLYLFLFYCLTVAYIVGGGGFLLDILSPSISAQFPWVGPLFFTLCFAPLVAAGTRAVSPINGSLVVAMSLLYIAFIALGYSHIQLDYLTRAQWSLSVMALPIAFAAFGYQVIIPSLVCYLNRDVARIRFAIVVGSAIPLVIYAIWQLLILGIVPLEGPNGLAAALAKGENAVQPLVRSLSHPALSFIGQLFAFAALLTSFLGVTLGLNDFLADGLGWKKEDKRLQLALLVFCLPLAIAIANPTIFLMALEIAGGVGTALILALLPIVMVWIGRTKFESVYSVRGGTPLLCALTCFVLFELGCELFLLLGVDFNSFF